MDCDDSDTTWPNAEQAQYDAALLCMECKTMLRILQTFTSVEGAYEGHPALAQSIFSVLNTYYNLDFMLIVPEGVVSTCKAYYEGVCLVQYAPETGRWTAGMRDVPWSSLTLQIDVDGVVSDFRPYFERFLRYYDEHYHESDFVPWYVIDTWFYACAAMFGDAWYNVRHVIDPNTVDYFLSPYTYDLIKGYELEPQITCTYDLNNEWIGHRFHFPIIFPCHTTQMDVELFHTEFSGKFILLS